MECSEKPIWNKYTKEELEQISIPKPMEEVRKQVLHNWDAIAKPIDGLGSFETLTARSEQLPERKRSIFLKSRADPVCRQWHRRGKHQPVRAGGYSGSCKDP